MVQKDPGAETFAIIGVGHSVAAADRGVNHSAYLRDGNAGTRKVLPEACLRGRNIAKHIGGTLHVCRPAAEKSVWDLQIKTCRLEAEIFSGRATGPPQAAVCNNAG